jgi:transcriptional regulator with XRE-family HTH domain
MAYLGKNLKFLRKNRGWNQEELAKELGVKRSSIAAYESKNVEPRLRVISRAADLLGVSFEEMVEKSLLEAQSFKEESSALAAFSMDSFFSFNPYERLEVKDFFGKVERMRKVVEGFKVLLSLKTQNQLGDPVLFAKEAMEVENILFLMDVLLKADEEFLQSVGNKAQL